MMLAKRRNMMGAYRVLSGPDMATGLDSQCSAEIAIKDYGGRIRGHAIKLNVEDDQCNAERGQTATTKLAANPQTVIVLGPSCSSAATPGAPILWHEPEEDLAIGAGCSPAARIATAVIEPI